ncbi:MAG: dephospho-CoA kinase [Veillonellaceae bacterium]|nr:dephospho-CoA kinase [Veillonellaceae bacterium]
MEIIGLTGGIAAGKSLTTEILRSCGIPVLDADVAARRVVEPGAPAWRAIGRAFGPEIYEANGQLDRPQLAERIFTNPAARECLNAIMHPAILAELQKETEVLSRAGEKLVCWDVPLLLDFGWERYVDTIWVVDVPESVQLERLMARNGLTEVQARARLAAQLSRRERLARADVVIENNDTPAALAAKVRSLVAERRENEHA